MLSCNVNDNEIHKKPQRLEERILCTGNIIVGCTIYFIVDHTTNRGEQSGRITAQWPTVNMNIYQVVNFIAISKSIATSNAYDQINVHLYESR